MIARIFLRLGGLAVLVIGGLHFQDDATAHGIASFVFAALLFWAASQLYRAERDHQHDLKAVAGSRDQEDES